MRWVRVRFLIVALYVLLLLRYMKRIMHQMQQDKPKTRARTFCVGAVSALAPSVAPPPHG